MAGPAHAPVRRFDGRAELGRFAALLGVTGVAFAQPVLAAFGDSPETFIFRNAEGWDLVWFVAVVALGPPVVLWAAGAVLGLTWPRARAAAHGASVGLMAAVVLAQVTAAWPVAATVVAAALVALGVGVLTVRSGSFRLWSQLLAALPAYAVVVFLVASPASDLLHPEGFAEARAGVGGAPVVLVILDELPTASLLDPQGGIDPVRFPNLAAFAQDATWYRNATTVAAFTQHAVPAILTGRLPEKVAPVYPNYPDNLFSLLAGSHDLVVSEALTRLCPTSECGDTPRRPGSAAPPVEEQADRSALLGDAISLSTERITGDGSAEIDLDAFQEATTTFGARSGSEDAPGPGDADQPVAQPTRLTAFLDALTPAQRPIAGVVHLVSPHSPWLYLPDGRRYADPAVTSGERTYTQQEAWPALVARQAHLLQASYADRLVGQVLRTLKASAQYDDAVVAIVADHGVSFAVGEPRRAYSPATAPEVVWVPMLVKAPGQSEGRIDESNVETTDLLPTIAAEAGVDIPWEVDGAPAGSEEIERRGARKTFIRFNNPLIQDQPQKRLTIDGRGPYRRMLASTYPTTAAGEDPVRALYEQSGRPELVGRPYRPSRATAGAVEVDDRDRLLAETRPVLSLSGAVRELGGATHVVAAVDGEIVAVSPIFRRQDGDPGFEVLLPTDRTVALAEVSLGLVDGGGAVVDAGTVGR